MFEHNNGTIRYQVAGEGEPIVFVHGFTLDHRMWAPQVAYFSQKYKVITYDARGFGGSSVPAGLYSHDDDLHALLVHLNIPRAHIVGLSMGGRIAINFTLAHPEMACSLALLDSTLDGYPNQIIWDVDAGKVGIGRAKELWLDHDVFAATRQKPAAMAALRAIIGDYSGWRWFHDDPRDPMDTNARAKLHAIRTPTLVVTGQEDMVYFQDIAAVLAADIPGAQKVTVPDAGHMVNLEAPDAVNALLSRFLGAHTLL